MNIKRSFQKYFDKKAYIRSINKKRLKEHIYLYERDIILALQEEGFNSEISTDYNNIEVIYSP